MDIEQIRSVLTNEIKPTSLSKLEENQLASVLIIIYGKVNGDVNTKGPVRIAQQAIVEGNITGSDIRVGGTVNGNIQSNGQVVLGKKSILKGDIIYRKLLIEDGAQFEGKCDLVVDMNPESVNN